MSEEKESAFTKVAQLLKENDELTSQLEQDELLELYSYYKQATEGDMGYQDQKILLIVSFHQTKRKVQNFFFCI